MDPDTLLGKVEAVFKSFKPTKGTPDAHALVCLGRWSEAAGSEGLGGGAAPPETALSGDGTMGAGLSDEDKTFVQQCFYGCVRYKKFLKVSAVLSPCPSVLALSLIRLTAPPLPSVPGVSVCILFQQLSGYPTQRLQPIHGACVHHSFSPERDGVEALPLHFAITGCNEGASLPFVSVQS